MVFTPYPKLNDKFENPTLRASYDGLVWVKLSGTPEPIVPAPSDPETHHADPDMVLCHDQLHVIYATINRNDHSNTFNFISSADSYCWSEPQTIHKGTEEVSPSCVVDHDLWHLWFIRKEKEIGSSELLHRQGSDLKQMKNEFVCKLHIPHHIAWHIDIQKIGEKYEALIAAFPEKTDNSRTCLFHATSIDGLHFTLSRRKAILSPSLFGWDNRMIYRSSFQRQPSGTYRIWYSAASWGSHCGIGYVEGPLDNLRESPSAPLASLKPSSTRLSEDFLGCIKYLASRHLPHSLLRILVACAKPEDSEK
jgi:hypothetical protein